MRPDKDTSSISSLRDLPSVRQLRAFMAVYRSGSISAAADILSVTQPAVTVLIRELEGKLGVRLFDRTTRRLSRTDAAAEAIAYAERALGELEAMASSMSDFAGARLGSLRIATTATVAQTVLPLVLGPFHERHPALRLVIDDCAPHEFVQRIANDQVDLGIGTLEERTPGLKEIPFLTDELVAAALPGRGFLEASRSRVHWKQLGRWPLLTVKAGYGVRRQIEAASREAGVRLQFAHEVSLLSTALALAASGLGVAIVPSFVLQRSAFGHLVARPIVGPKVTRTTAVVHRDDRAPNPAMQALIDCLASAFRKPIHKIAS